MKAALKPRTGTRAPVAGDPRQLVIPLWIASTIYFALALLFFLPAFLPGNHIYGTDYLVGGYFFHEFISQRFADGSLPKWVPHVYGGLPLFANPGSTYHPVRFLADALFSTSRIWPTYFVVHFALAGVGTYLLCRELGIRSWVAFLAGLGFQFTGLTMSWVLGGHEGRIIVATLTPLVFYFYHVGIRTGTLAPFVGAAAALTFALLTFQIQSSYYLLLGSAIWAAFVIVGFGVHRELRKLSRVLLAGFASVALAFAIASVNFLPFLDYVEQSPRGGVEGRGYEYSISWSMPPREITGLAVPEDVGFLETYRGENPFKLHTEYVGAVVLLLAAIGFAVGRRDRYWWFFLGLGLFALSIAFGGHTLIYHLYYELLPGTKRFRAPSIAFFLVSVSLVMMAALTLERLARWREEKPNRSATSERAGALRTASWVLVGVTALAVLAFLASAAGADVDPISQARVRGFGRTLLFVAAAAGVLWAWVREKLPTAPFVVLLALLTVTDLWIVDRRFFTTVDAPEEMFAPDDVVRYLRAQPGPFRVWVLPFPAGAIYRGQAGNYLMHFGIDQAGGEHGNQLQRFNEYLGAGTEVYVDWHNFFVDPRVVEGPEGPALAFRSVDGFLEGANIRYVISGVPLQHPALQEVHRGTALVYLNRSALPRAYVAPAVEVIPDDRSALQRLEQGWDPAALTIVTSAQPLALPPGLRGEAQVVEYTPDRVVVRTQQDREGLLVLADNYYPGWRATVNGQERPIYLANHSFRGVVTDAGENLVVFSYEPTELRIGFWIYLAGMTFLVVFGLWSAGTALRRRRRPPPAE